MHFSPRFPQMSHGKPTQTNTTNSVAVCCHLRGAGRKAVKTGFAALSADCKTKQDSHTYDAWRAEGRESWPKVHAFMSS